MKTQKISVIICLAALVTFAASATQEQLAKSINEARIETMRTADQLAATLTSLNALTQQKKGDLRPSFETFQSEIKKTDSAANTTAARAQWMAQDGINYFKTWQKTVDGIANESLRKKAQKRLNTVNESYGKVESSLAQAKEKFAPFLSDLRDVEKSLSADVTANGVKAIRGTVKTANWDHQFVSKAIQSAIKEMDKMSKALSPEAK